MSVTPPPTSPPPPTGGTPDPEPRPAARPLDPEEQRSLTDLEQRLRLSDPDLDDEMGSLRDPAGAGGGAADRNPADRVLQSVAVAVIVLVLVPADWVAGLLSFGLLLGIPLAMALIAIRAKREDAARHGPDGDTDDTDRRP